MPKLSSPSVKFVLKNRFDRNGNCPVILIIRWYGRVDRATGVNVKPNQWDAVRERVRCNHPNAAGLNAMLTTYRSNIMSAASIMIAQGDVVTPQKLICYMNDKPKGKECMRVSDAYSFYIESHELGIGTVDCYKSSFNCYKRFCKDVLIADVTVKLCGEWVSSMLKSGMAVSSVHQYFRCFLAAMGYTCRKKKIAFDVEEFKDVIHKVPRKRKGSTVVMDEGNVNSIIRWLASFDDDELVCRSNNCCCMAIFISSYLFGGVAPTDMATLRADDFTVTDKYITCSGSRRKTGIPFNVVVPLNELISKVIGAFFRTADSRDGLLFPMICGGNCSKVDLSDKSDIHRAVDRFCGMFRLKFPKAIDELNSTLADDEKIPVGMTFYSARHSFASNYVKKSGNIAALASILGRSVNTIATYVKQINRIDELLEERLKMK